MPQQPLTNLIVRFEYKTGFGFIGTGERVVSLVIGPKGETPQSYALQPDQARELARNLLATADKADAQDAHPNERVRASLRASRAQFQRIRAEGERVAAPGSFACSERLFGSGSGMGRAGIEPATLGLRVPCSTS